MPDCEVFATGFGKRRSAKRIYLTNCFSYYEFSTASVQWTRAGDGCRRERTEAWSFRHGRRNIDEGIGVALLLEAAFDRLAIPRDDRSEERRVGKSVSVRVDIGGRSILKQKIQNTYKYNIKDKH